MKKQVVVISNMDDNTYFFSKDHCQNHGLGSNFVPCTHYLPSQVEPRESVPDLYAHATGFTQSEKVIESLQAETRIRLKKLYGKDAKIDYPAYMYKTPDFIEREIDDENKKGKIEWKF
jgi:hypothetical protein